VDARHKAGHDVEKSGELEQGSGDTSMIRRPQRQDNDKNQVQVIARAASIPARARSENAGLSLGQIAQRVGLARSTVQRIVASLASEKLLIAASRPAACASAHHPAGSRQSVRSDFVAMARPSSPGCRPSCARPWTFPRAQRPLVFIDQVIGSHRLRTVSAVGETFPLHCTANGKAYLSRLDCRRDRAPDRANL